MILCWFQVAGHAQTQRCEGPRSQSGSRVSQPATSVVAAFVLVLILWLIIISVAIYAALTFYICNFSSIPFRILFPSFFIFFALYFCPAYFWSFIPPVIQSFVCLFLSLLSRLFPGLFFIPPISWYLSSVLGFQDLCDETHSWINEKDQALSTEDCGRDLSTVQALQRRHQVRPTSTYFSYCR